MHSFAIFAVTEHIAELQAEAARARRHRVARPSRLRRIAAAIAAAFTAPAMAAPPIHAFHASK